MNLISHEFETRKKKRIKKNLWTSDSMKNKKKQDTLDLI